MLVDLEGDYRCVFLFNQGVRPILLISKEQQRLSFRVLRQKFCFVCLFKEERFVFLNILLAKRDARIVS
jgi:hypothetical protein